MMKKRVVTTSGKSVHRKQHYAVFNQEERLIRKGSFTAQEIQDYLNQKANEDKRYYAIELKGLKRKLTRAELKPLESKIAKGKGVLPARDVADLKALLTILKTKPAWQGMIRAFHFDTALREEIPISIWKKMGGETL